MKNANKTKNRFPWRWAMPLPRFRNYNDAMAALRRLAMGIPIGDLIVMPFIRSGKDVRDNPDYASARYELGPVWTREQPVNKSQQFSVARAGKKRKMGA